MNDRISRRQFAVSTGSIAGAALLANSPSPAPGAEPASSEPFIYGLNTGTIRGHELSIVEQVDVTAKAGYRAIEP